MKTLKIALGSFFVGAIISLAPILAYGHAIAKYGCKTIQTATCITGMC